MASSVQLTVDGDCDCLMQESTDVVLCLADGWEAKTINGTTFVLGTIVSVNEKCTSVKKGNCYYPGVKSCEYVVDILTDQFEAVDVDEDPDVVWEPESDDVLSVTKSNCFYDTIINLITTNMRISDDEQNLLTTLPDGLLIPQATIVTGCDVSDEATAFPVVATVVMTNPSTFLPMRVIGTVEFHGRFATVADATARTVTRNVVIDGNSPHGGAQLVGFIPTATGSAMNTSFEWTEDFGFITNIDDDLTLLDPGESKTYSVEFAGTVVGGDIMAIGCRINLTGINFSPFVP